MYCYTLDTLYHIHLTFVLLLRLLLQQTIEIVVIGMDLGNTLPCQLMHAEVSLPVVFCNNFHMVSHQAILFSTTLIIWTLETVLLSIFLELSNGNHLGAFHWNSGGLWKGQGWETSLPNDSQV